MKILYLSKTKHAIKRYSELKKHNRTSPDVQRNFIDKTKTRSRTDYERFGKTISEKSDKNKKKQNQCQNAACGQKNH